jgi:hypothetical protein
MFFVFIFIKKRNKEYNINKKCGKAEEEED